MRAEGYYWVKPNKEAICLSEEWTIALWRSPFSDEKFEWNVAGVVLSYTDANFSEIDENRIVREDPRTAIYVKGYYDSKDLRELADKMDKNI